MSRVYAYEEDGTRHLVRIECDESACSAVIKPHREIAQSGWVKCASRDASGVVCEWEYCPEHTP